MNVRHTLIILALCGSVAAAPAVSIYVSPRGNDGWDGSAPDRKGSSIRGPLLTIKAALDKAGIIARTPVNRTEPTVVVLRGGQYPLDQPLEITPATLGLDPRKTANPQVIIITDYISLYPEELYRKTLESIRAAIGPDLFRFYRSIGVNLKQLYGQTETCAYVCLQPDGQTPHRVIQQPDTTEEQAKRDADREGDAVADTEPYQAGDNGSGEGPVGKAAAKGQDHFPWRGKDDLVPDPGRGESLPDTDQEDQEE